MKKLEKNVEKQFLCSLCHSGLVGGVLYLNSDELRYRTNKLIFDEKYRNLVMPIKNIREINWKRFLFPIATFSMLDGEEYTIMIYNKSRFMKAYQEIIGEHKE
jgi:hypothetical protein